MSSVHLSLACGDYEIMRPLADGSVRPDGVDLTVLTGDRARILVAERRAECDLAEFNVVAYLMESERDPDLFALPVFPHRRLRLGFIFVNRAAGIDDVADLAGRSGAVTGERPAAVVWLRGILNEHFEVGYDDARIVDPSGYLGRPHESRAGVEDLLLAGEVDALICPSFPPSFLAGDPRIGRLFPDYRERDLAYYEQTGIFPIMHAVTIRRRILERDPWIASSLFRAFCEAKQAAYRRVRNPRVMPLVLFQHAWEEQAELFGPDPWRYGLGGANAANLGTILRYSEEQGLVTSGRSLGELFADLDEAGLDRFAGY